MNFENELKLGLGIYTTSEIASILRVSTRKVYVWMNKYWDGQLGKEYNTQYSWKTKNERAVSFHTFIEFYLMLRLSQAGVKTKAILKAHKELSRMYNTAFPFALKQVLQDLRCDGKNLLLQNADWILELNGTKQLNLGFIEMFFVKLDFDENNLASRFWPMGKEKSILIDPQRKFGHPVVDNRNIYPEVIYNHHKAGDPIKYIAYVYELTEAQVHHAIEYCNAA